MKKNIFWLASSAILVIIFVTIYTVVQQSQRSDANYPQIQIAEDTANALNSGAQPNTQIQGKIDPQNSLAPFTIIYNLSGQVVTGSGYLNGRIPTIPLGVLRSAIGKDFNSVTWEPQSGVRIASIEVAANKYYVLSGRSLKEVEKNENISLDLSLFGLALALATEITAYALYPKKSK